MRQCLDAGVALEIRGSPGIGKSDIVKQFKKEQRIRDGFEWGISTVMMPTQNPTDLCGFMIPGKRADGSIATTWTDPVWMTTDDGKPLNAYQRGIVLLEEFPQADIDTKKGAAELILNGRINTHSLPEGWGVLMLGNRAGDRSGVTKDMDFLINRRILAEVEADPMGWQTWAILNGVHPTFVAFAHANGGIVFDSKVPERQGPWCTPRSLSMLSHSVVAALKDPKDHIPTDSDDIEFAQGAIGDGAAAQLYATIRLVDQLPRFEQIVHDPRGAPIPATPDAQMLVIFSLADRVDEGTMEAVVIYMNRMPEEFAVTFGKVACKRDPSLASDPHLRDWRIAHADFMMAVL
jgi:hypothetical protein